MAFIDILLNRKNVYKLRKEYDRLREKADREPDMTKKFNMLHLLDTIEPTLVILEEQILPNMEKKRMIKFVDQNLQKARLLLKDKYSPVPSQPHNTYIQK